MNSTLFSLTCTTTTISGKLACRNTGLWHSFRWTFVFVCLSFSIVSSKKNERRQKNFKQLWAIKFAVVKGRTPVNFHLNTRSMPKDTQSPWYLDVERTQTKTLRSLLYSGHRKMNAHSYHSDISPSLQCFVHRSQQLIYFKFTLIWIVWYIHLGIIEKLTTVWIASIIFFFVSHTHVVYSSQPPKLK